MKFPFYLLFVGLALLTSCGSRKGLSSVEKSECKGAELSLSDSVGVSSPASIQRFEDLGSCFRFHFAYSGCDRQEASLYWDDLRKDGDRSYAVVHIDMPDPGPCEAYYQDSLVIAKGPFEEQKLDSIYFQEGYSIAW